MSFKDKAKEVIDTVVEKVKDPDGSLVEKSWPPGEGPTPDTKHGAAEGTDPDIEASSDDQYDKD